MTNMSCNATRSLTVTKSGVNPDPRMEPIGVDKPRTAVAK